MKKLILLLLFIPLVSFGQDNEKKFEGVIKENRFKNFIRTAYYPTSPFINPFDTIVVIGKNITTGNSIKIIIDDRDAALIKNDFSLNPKDFYTPQISDIKKVVEKEFDLRDLSKEEKNSISNLILKNINNREYLKLINVPSTISSKIINSQNKRLKNRDLLYNFDYLKYNFRRAIYNSNSHYIKINFNELFDFSYKIKMPLGRTTFIRIKRKHINPPLDLVYKIDSDRFYEFIKASLDEFYNNK